MSRVLLACIAGIVTSLTISAQQDGGGNGAAARREDAYRQNNIGVARLEQYDYAGAVTAFKQSLELRPELALARLNLAIALLHDGQLDAAAREANTALDQLPAKPQSQFVGGLIAKAANRLDEAAAAFQRAAAMDAADPGSRVQLGQVRLAQREFGQAVSAFEAALRLEPFNATAAYGLAVALTRAGERERGEATMSRFQSLRENPAAITYSNTYLEQGRHGEALVSTGLEPELVDPTTPAVTFVDATAAVVRAAPGPVRSVALADMDADGRVDLLAVGDAGVQILRNREGRFEVWLTIPVKDAAAALAGDYDNDGNRDVLVLTEHSVSLFHQEPDATFRDVTAATLPEGLPAARAAAFADADHDGDLDVIVGSRLLRNNGNGRFVDVTADAGLEALSSPLAIVPTDYDNRRDVDLFVVNNGAAPVLYSNQRDGTFRNVAADAGLPTETAFTAVAVADINKDLAPDFFLARAGAAGVFASSTSTGRFTLTDAPVDTKNASAALLVDYDNDGLTDLFAWTPAGPRLWRFVGTRWVDASSPALPLPLVPDRETATAIAAADLDDDGDQDLVVRLSSGSLRVWRNDGGDRNKSVRVRLGARVSNRDAAGAKVDLRAGSLRHRIETFITTPAVAPADIVFGLASRAGADVVRVLWPAGILQAETDVSLPQTTIAELDRKPSSCPFLYTWNGSRFEFVTDFLGGGELGYWVAPGVRNVPDPDEYVRIPPGALVPRDGRLDLRITNELEEAVFLDKVQLLAAAHPIGVDVHPNEGLRSPEHRSPLTLYTTRGPKPPLSATDEHGCDVRDRIAALDQRSVDDFGLAPIQGYADPHSITFDTGATAADRRVLLLLTGWTDYAFSSDNVAAQQAGLAFRPPALLAKDSSGEWRTVVAEIGLPVGRPQTVVVDITPHTKRGMREFRIDTTLRVYWDQIAVDVSEPSRISVATLDPREATLRWRGFSAETERESGAPPSYDYERVTDDSPWKLMAGRYTRHGDVTTLLAAIDDQYVVSAPGDEIALSFDATAVPALPRGWTRTFLLHADGFSKEMNLHSASPDALEPLPFHGMTAYPYAPPERYPDTPAHRRYREEFNTRAIGRPMPPMEKSR